MPGLFLCVADDRHHVDGDHRGMLGSRDLISRDQVVIAGDICACWSFEGRDLNRLLGATGLLPGDSDEAVEVQAKPYGGCRREDDANDKPEEHEQKFVARGTRDHALVHFCVPPNTTITDDSRLCHGAGIHIGDGQLPRPSISTAAIRSPLPAIPDASDAAIRGSMAVAGSGRCKTMPKLRLINRLDAIYNR
jgi:hypothetical protein